MVTLVTAFRLAAYALGALGGVLVFVEFFQMPSYVNYEEEFESYQVDTVPQEVREHTWAGRLGGLAVALSFVLLFVAALL